MKGRNERNGGMGEGRERWRKTDEGGMKSEEKAENKKGTERNS